MRVGTSNFFRSSVISVSENALMQKLRGGKACQHALQPERLAHALRHFGAGPVVAVEGQTQILPELRPVGNDARPELVEYLDRRARRIGLRLEHQRRHGAGGPRLGHALGSMTPDVTSHLAAAGRVADMARILEV